jgi:tryptophan-rich sensory protein
MNSNKRPISDYLLLVLFIAIPLIIGYTASLSTIPAIKGWYQTINKPSFNPPNWIFGPVWTFLYVLMGIGSWMIWLKRKTSHVSVALAIYFVSLVFNFMWSILFFKLQSPQMAIVDISILLGIIILMIVKWRKINPTAAYIQIPYLLWVSFATVLNAAIVHLN